MATRFMYKALLTAGRNTVLSMSVAVATTLATTNPARADVVTDWNAMTVGYVNTAARPAPAWILDLAIVHIAIHIHRHHFRPFLQVLLVCRRELMLIFFRPAMEIIDVVKNEYRFLLSETGAQTSAYNDKGDADRGLHWFV